MIKVLTM